MKFKINIIFSFLLVMSISIVYSADSKLNEETILLTVIKNIESYPYEFYIAGINLNDKVKESGPIEIKPFKIIYESYNTSMPIWSPNRKYFSYISDKNSKSRNIYIYSIKNRNKTRITHRCKPQPNSRCELV